MKSKRIPRWMIFGTKQRPRHTVKRAGRSVKVSRVIDRRLVFDLLMHKPDSYRRIIKKNAKNPYGRER